MTDDPRPFHFITDAETLVRVAAEVLTGAKEIGVDCEMNGLHAFRARTCVLQIATETADVVVDTVVVKDLRCLEPILSSKEIVHFLHGAAHDVKCMKADFGLMLGGLFDTYVAAQLLGVEKLGYGDIVNTRFGVTLDKALQTCDWGKRPLEKKQIEYLKGDVRYLIELGRQLRAELIAKDLLEEATYEFGRVAALPIDDESLAADAYLRPKESRELAPIGLAVLRELMMVRHAIARGLDRPPFKVVRDEVLVEIARKRPTSSEELGKIQGLPRHASPRMLAELHDAVLRGVEAGAPPPLPARVVIGPRPDSDEIRARRAREDALRSWRKQTAGNRSVPPMAVLPSYSMEDIVRDPPASLDALAKRPGLIPKRVKLHGAAILQTLATATASSSSRRDAAAAAANTGGDEG